MKLIEGTFKTIAKVLCDACDYDHYLRIFRFKRHDGEYFFDFKCDVKYTFFQRLKKSFKFMFSKYNTHWDSIIISTSQLKEIVYLLISDLLTYDNSLFEENKMLQKIEKRSKCIKVNDLEISCNSTNKFNVLNLYSSIDNNLIIEVDICFFEGDGIPGSINLGWMLNKDLFFGIIDKVKKSISYLFNRDKRLIDEINLFLCKEDVVEVLSRMKFLSDAIDNENYDIFSKLFKEGL